MKSFLTAGLAVFVCAAFAGTSQDFDGLETTATVLPTQWSADGVWSIETKSATETSNMVLSFDGSVTNANVEAATAAASAKTAFLVKAPVEATATGDLPSETDLEGCQIAVATGACVSEDDDSKLKIVVYQGTNAGWVDSGLSVTTDSWFSVGLEFKYGATTPVAMLTIDGTPATNTFSLVTKQEATSKISSLVFVGASKIDDVSIDEVLALDTLPSGVATELANMSVYTNELGVSGVEIADTATKYGNLTVAQRIVTGLEPKGNETFTATEIASAADGKTVIAVPCTFDNGQVYKVVVTGVAANGTATETPVEATAGAITDGVRSVSFTIPSDRTEKVLKFVVQACAPSAQQ